MPGLLDVFPLKKRNIFSSNYFQEEKSVARVRENDPVFLKYCPGSNTCVSGTSFLKHSRKSFKRINPFNSFHV